MKNLLNIKHLKTLILKVFNSLSEFYLTNLPYNFSRSAFT